MGELHCHQLAHAQAAGEEHLDDGLVALPFPLAQVDGCLQLVHLLGGEHLGQVTAQLGRLQEFRGVIVAKAIEQQETEETPYPTQYATLRAGMDAHLMQTGGKLLQIFKLAVERRDASRLQEEQQFVEVAAVGLLRVGREVALQPQILQILLGQCFLSRRHDAYAPCCAI